MFESKRGNPSSSLSASKRRPPAASPTTKCPRSWGFSRANVYQAIKSGAATMPAIKLTTLAAVLDASPADVLASYLRDTAPDLLQVIEKVWGAGTLTAQEQKVLQAYRVLAGDRDVEPSSSTARTSSR